MANTQKIFAKLKKYGLMEVGHSGKLLIDHLKGVYEILKSWECSEELCLAGLCHSVYGAQSKDKKVVPFDSRDTITDVIGKEAEEIAYYFNAHDKKQFWEILELTSRYQIKDRFNGDMLRVTEKMVSELVTLTLANLVRATSKGSS